MFWNYPKPQFLVPKALTHQNISKFLVTEICHASRVLGANVVNRGFEGCGFDFWHFFRFWKKLLEKHLFRPGKKTRSPGGCSCGSTFKNIHFSKKYPKPQNVSKNALFRLLWWLWHNIHSKRRLSTWTIAWDSIMTKFWKSQKWRFCDHPFLPYECSMVLKLDLNL